MTKKTGYNKLRGKKRQMIDALSASFTVTAATAKVGIDRSTHYDWIKKDEDYAKAFSEVDEKEIDFYETALRKLINQGNPAATIFALKSKGKRRGWVERQEYEQAGSVDIGNEITVNIKRNNDK